MFRFLTAGESHGPGLTIMVEGLPAGLKVSEEDIKIDLQRRQKGFGRGGRMKIEKIMHTLNLALDMVLHLVHQYHYG